MKMRYRHLGGDDFLVFFKRDGAFLLVVDVVERFAQEALGHNSKAVHRAYAKWALMKIPSLEEYEQRAAVKVEPAA
jgi:hypothetical protein